MTKLVQKPPRPNTLLLGAFAEESVSHRSELFADTMKIQDLDRVAETVLCQVPFP
jgi:hypothetical protein